MATRVGFRSSCRYRCYRQRGRSSSSHLSMANGIGCHVRWAASERLFGFLLPSNPRRLAGILHCQPGREDLALITISPLIFVILAYSGLSLLLFFVKTRTLRRPRVFGAPSLLCRRALRRLVRC